MAVLNFLQCWVLSVNCWVQLVVHQCITWFQVCRKWRVYFFLKFDTQYYRSCVLSFAAEYAWFFAQILVIFLLRKLEDIILIKVVDGCDFWLLTILLLKERIFSIQELFFCLNERFKEGRIISPFQLQILQHFRVDISHHIW